MNCDQLISDPSTYVKKRAQRSDDSILLRHMDDVVGTGPEEHLMSDFEHMKTSLYLTDVVELRHEGDTVNFLGLEITRTSKGFEVKNSTDLVESLLNLYGLQNSKPTANPGRRSTVMELASATPLEGHDDSNFRTAVGKLIFMAPWRPDMQFAIQQLSTQVLNPTTESKRAVKQLIRYLKGTQHTCLRLEPREMIQTGLLELVGRGDSDWARDSATRQSVTGCLEMDSDSARHILQRRRDQVDSNTSSNDAWQYNNGYEQNVYPRFEWTRGTTQPIFSRNTLTDCVQEHLRRNWD